jgi:ATP-dependent RNA helicase DeaD
LALSTQSITETSSSHFGDLPVGPQLARALQSMGYSTPTPIQEQAIPVLREGRDVLGQAQTGTGKTAGFGIPLIESINTARREVQAIVLVPTRELCMQVAEEISRLGKPFNVGVVAVYGGVGLGPQISALRNGAHVVVGTPGRVEDLLERRALRLEGVRMAILDEADRMLDVGFLPAIERILRRTPPARQTALFSATIPSDVLGLANRQMREPVTISVDPERATVDEIEQRFERVPDGDKLKALRQHLDDPSCFLALIFRRTTYKVDKLVRDLSRDGYKVAALHGRRTQGQRERVLADLKSAKLQAVVATDIAARGLDITGLTHVFNFDLPDTPETYVHRIGRTGRAGETGTAVMFIAPDDEEGLRAIERHLAGERAGTKITRGSSAQSRSNDRGFSGGRGQQGPRRDENRRGQSGRSNGNGSPFVRDASSGNDSYRGDRPNPGRRFNRRPAPRDA